MKNIPLNFVQFQVAVTTALDEVCSLLPDTLSAECEEFVNTYGAVIVNLLVQNIDPKTICTRVGLCTAKTMSPVLNQKPLSMYMFLMYVFKYQISDIYF